MWIRCAAILTLCLAQLPAAAEPRIPGMDAQLEADMARADYLFVWDLDINTLGRGDSYRMSRTYYDGLMFALTEGRRLIEPGTPAKVKLDPMPAVRGWDEAYAGRLVSHETSLEGEPLVMHAEITRRDCDRKRSQVFFALSRQPRDDPAWKEMRKIRDAIGCDKSATR